MILNSTNIQRKYGIFWEPKSEKLPAMDPENINGSLHFIVVSVIICFFFVIHVISKRSRHWILLPCGHLITVWSGNLIQTYAPFAIFAIVS